MEDTDSLRSSAPQWSLAGDKQLLGVLQNIHERLVTRCRETNKRLGEMAAALDDASIDLQNVNNKFMALSNSQFIESRVYDDDDVAAAVEPPKDPPKPTDASSDLERMQLGLKILEDMHEPLQILDSDSESDSEEELGRTVLKPKDLYSDRPLPYIIGSYEWQSKWHAGLLPEDSDTDSSVKREPWDRDEYSESETEAGKPYGKTKDQESLSSEEFGSEQVTQSQLAPTAPKSQASVANELARRLRGELPEPDTQMEEDDAPPTSQVKKVYRPEKPAPSNIFLDEPPPLDQSYQSDEENDIFAELRKNQPYAPSNKAQNDVTDELFGNNRTDDDPFRDFREPPPPVNQKSTLFSEESEPELFAEQPPPAPRTSTDNNVKKPIGGVSLFGSKGTETIGAAILKRNQRQSSTEDEGSDDNDKVIQEKQNDIFDQLFAKSEKEKRKVEKKVEKEAVKEKREDKKVDLFNDNLFDDIDDIFTTNIPKVATKNDETKKSLFDNYDDLFSNVAINKGNNSVKDTTKDAKDSKKSIFDSDDDLFTDEVVKDVSVKDKGKINDGIKKETSKIDTKKSIFDSDDELFAEKLSNKESATSKTSEVKDDLFIENPTKESVKSNTKSIFDDSDSAEFSNDGGTKSQEVSVNSIIEERTSIVKSDNNKDLDRQSINKELPIPETKKASLFDDDDEDLFKTESTDKEIQKTNEILYSDNIKPSSSITNFRKDSDNHFNEQNSNVVAPINESKTAENPQKSIFDDESEDELFSDKPITVAKNDVIKVDKNKSKSNIFDSDDDLFKETIIPRTTHIGAREEIKSEIKDEILEDKKDEIKSDIKDNVITKLKDDLTIDKKFQDLEEKQTETLKQVKSSIFDDDEDDIFKESLVEKVTNNDKIEKVDNKALFEDLEDDLFSNSSNSGNVNKIDDIPKESTLPEKAEITPENTKPEISKPYASIDINTQDKQKQDDNAPLFNKSAAFDDIFIEPPEFEKPKEPKKSKNVNALFDDDSDDEALFFKKDDPTLDEKPEFDSPTTENRLFGIFQDEPPALDVDFVQKSNVKSKKVDSIQSDTKASGDTNKDSAKDSSVLKSPIDDITPKSKEDINKLVDSPPKEPKPEVAAPKQEDKIDSPTKTVGKLKSMNFNINVNALLPGASPKKVKPADQTDGNTQTKSSEDIRIKNTHDVETKIVKSISFEGKPESQVLDNTLSKERAKIQVKRRPSTRRARMEAVRKSGIDFGDDSTDNSSSIDDQPKVVKKVNKDDVKAKEIELSKSDDEISSAKNTIDTSRDDEDATLKVKNKNIESIATNTNLETEKPRDSKHEESSKQVKEDVNTVKESIVKEATTPDDLFTQKSEVTTKTVYILNDEDIFNIEKPKKVLNIVDDPSISTLGKVYNEPKMSTSDSDDELFKNVSKSKSNESDEELFKPQTKKASDKIDTIDSDESLFKTKTVIKESSILTDDKSVEENIFKPETKTEKTKEAERIFKPEIKEDKAKSIFDLSDDEDLFSKKKSKKEEREDLFKKEVKKVDIKASLFGDDDDDLFGSNSSKKTEASSSSTQPSRAKEVFTKSSEPVFEDPLSLLGDDD